MPFGPSGMENFGSSFPFSLHFLATFVHPAQGTTAAQQDAEKEVEAVPSGFTAQNSIPRLWIVSAFHSSTQARMSFTFGNKTHPSFTCPTSSMPLRIEALDFQRLN